MKTFIKPILLAIILLSCDGTQNYKTSESESFVFHLYVTKVDVCRQVLTSTEQRKVLFVINEGVFGFALSETEKLVLIYQYTQEDKDERRNALKVFRSDLLQELYCVDLNITERGILIFVSPIITQEESCKTRINTTSYIFSSDEPKK